MFVIELVIGHVTSFFATAAPTSTEAMFGFSGKLKLPCALPLDDSSGAHQVVTGALMS